MNVVRTLALAAGCLAAGLIAMLPGSDAGAQAPSNYPNRPIHIIVPYPAGGIVDIVARAVTEQVGRDWKQTVVVEARPGGNSNIGTSAVARSDPDGYTWLVTGPAVLVNPTLYKDAGWDALKNFRCVGLAVWNQSVALVHPSMPVKTIGEFVELARSKPGQLNFGNPGTGSSIDLSAQKLFQAADIKLTNVGYKGQPQALIDLMTNLMHFEIVSLELALPHIKAGTVKPLAVFTDKRVADLPEVPTIAEAGFPAAAYVPWYGIYVPSATPDALAGKINEAINKALQNPDVQRQLSLANIPGKPMPLRSRGADEGGPREADDGDQDVRHGAAVERRERESHRHCEEQSDEAIHRRARLSDGLLRGAGHRARVRATRWLAMTTEKPAQPLTS
jgi:tripartite-type tricarboxylate transporter receptor subunit TctC